MHIKFNYLTELEFIAVQCSIEKDKDDNGSPINHILNSNSILNSLYGNDVDLISPNPKTVYQLNSLNIPFKEFLATLEEKVGKPYQWSQKLCGIDFLSCATIQSSIEVALPEIIKKLRLRWETRQELSKQIRIFEENSSDVILAASCSGDGNKKPYAIKISSDLLLFQTMTLDDYEHEAAVNDFTLPEMELTEHDLFYKAVIVRGTAKIETFIYIPCNFPENLATWNLVINWKGKKSSNTSTAVREIEFWINSVKRTSKNIVSTLSEQMERLLYSIDIYLETEGPLQGVTDFVPDKNFVKIFRGRQRSRPFKIISNEGCTVFTQI